MTTAIAYLLALSAAPDGAAKGPAELQGAWRLASVAAEAGSVDLPDPRPALLIKGDRVLYGGQEIARLAADAATDPKAFDLHFAKPERVHEGIYALDKNSLKVCINGRTEGVKERPDSFVLKERPARRLLTFERIKPDEAGPGSGFVGLALRLDEQSKSVVVEQVLDGSPAKKAGLRKDDVVLEVGGAAVPDLRAAVGAVRRAKPGGDLVVRIRRGEEEREITVKVGRVPFAVLAGLE